ncbi:uncharacterized protein F5147DRAFT_712972 [Suillus discolor]|uniref:ATP-citrate synthase citrate-binding domain-containing protein n=1 Tax=Suillus discolor TaxID=1912936 RepID=A0A9P7JQJ3_9AGAM|nr:uncharacterized protein F5147DRAFT_712972 [Suillus discolor]KAG2098959.1 hypothetical protein F5147DRAFT_712972 [Suillus discolor]
MNSQTTVNKYSGAPSKGQIFEYAKTILDLLTRPPRSDGKILIIGGITNFANVLLKTCPVRSVFRFNKHLPQPGLNWTFVTLCDV